MRSIQAIIIYNGGSAGDFLKGVCNQQITQTCQVEIDQRGHVEFPQHYFKSVTEALYRGDQPVIDFDLVHPVENTHYFSPSLSILCRNLFFIDYPDHLHDFVIDRLCHTRFNGDRSRVFDLAVQYLPETIKKRLNQSNTNMVLRTAHQRNLRQWRNNPLLQPVNMLDLVYPQGLLKVVKTICGIDTVNQDQLFFTQSQWLKRNPQLSEYLV